MIWNVKNSAKRKSLLERLVNIEEHEDAAHNEVVESHNEPAAWRSVVVSSIPDWAESSNQALESDLAPESEDIAAPAAEKSASYTDALYDAPEPAADEEPVSIEDPSDVSEALDRGEKIYISTSPNKKYFDILERAKEAPGGDREAMKIDYVLPKTVYSVPIARDDESYSSKLPHFIEKLDMEEESPVRASVESVHESEVGGAIGLADIEEEVPAEPSAEDETSIVAETPVEEPVLITEPEMVITEPVTVVEDPVTHEPVKAQRSIAFEKLLFPDEYFYAKNQSVFKNADQLHSSFKDMDAETFEHHAVARDANDFANWIRHVYGHHECADRLCNAKTKDEHLQILGEYL